MFRRFSCFLIAALFPVLALLVSCGSGARYEGYSDGPKGIYYKLHTNGGETKKIVAGDYVFMKAVYLTEKDSVFWDWRYNAGKNYFFKVTEKKMAAPFLGFLLSRYSAGDSLSLRVDKTIFFRDVFDTIPPWFVQHDSLVRAELMIEKVMNGEEFIRFAESGELRIEAEKWQQKKSIEEWVLVNMKEAVKADSLLYYERTTVTGDSAVKPGKTVTLCYKGCFMDGRVFDEVKAEKALTISYGFEGQLLCGMEKVTGLLRKGESAKIIIPSHLGFGEYGSSNGSVPPNTPVVYEITILDIK